MELVIYADVLFLKDFGMTFFLLMIVGEVLGIKYRLFRVFAAGIITSVCTICLVVYDLNQSFFSKIILAIMTTKCAFRSNSIKELCIQSGTLLMISFMIGGLHYSSFQRKGEQFFLSILMLISFYQAVKYFKINKWTTRNTYHLQFDFLNQTISMQAFLDTGNFLTNGMMEDPVIVVSLASLQDKLPHFVYSLLVDGIVTQEAESIFGDIRVVDYSVLNETQKKVYGICIHHVVIQKEYKTKLKSAVLIISKKKFHFFDALIGLSALEGGRVDGDITSLKTKSREILC